MNLVFDFKSFMRDNIISYDTLAEITNLKKSYVYKKVSQDNSITFKVYEKIKKHFDNADKYIVRS